MSTTHFENLSNEIFYEAFDYLDGIDIFNAFSNLNDRFEQLLNSSSFRFKIQLYPPADEYELYIKIYKQLMLLHEHQISSFHLSTSSQNEQILSSFHFHSSLDHLESLVLNEIRPTILIQLLSNLTFLPRLFSLTINIWEAFPHLSEMYVLIFALPLLKYNKFILHVKNTSMTLPIAMSNQFSPIEYLFINHYCSLNELASLISYTPQLHRLTLHKIKMNDPNITILSSITLINLKSIYLDLCQTKFNELEMVVRKAFPNLKSLSIIASEDVTFLDAHRWQQLILNHFSQLEKFYLMYDDHINNEQKYPMYTGRSNQFFSSFWFERQWHFEAHIKYTNIEYTIRPYRKRWYDNIKDNIVTCSVEHFTFTNLTLECILDFIFEDVVEKQIERILRITQIYHLEIHEKNFAAPLLIQTVKLLPDITTLKVHSLSIPQEKELTINEIFILWLIAKTSKITKVYVEEIGDVEEIDIIFKLCPYLEYFKAGYINMMNVQSFLQTIFKKIDDYNNYHLGSLCFNVQTPDDRLVKNIQEMIKCKKPLPHLIVKHVLDTVYLQWK